MEETQVFQERISYLGKTLRFFMNLVFALIFFGFLAVYLPKAIIAWELLGEEWTGIANTFFCYLLFAAIAAKLFFYYAAFRLFEIAFRAEEENRNDLVMMVRDEFLKYWPVRYIIKKICQIKEKE
jgi:hypothetical protein